MIMHNWTEAEKYAKVIVDTAPLGSAADLLQGFSDINLKNVIFGCDVTADNSGIYASFFSQMDMFGQGYAAIGVARVAHNYLTAAIADNDIRLDWFFNKRNFAKLCTEFGGQPKALAFYDQACKFIGAGRSVVYGNWHLGDEIFLRSEEAHFCLAEIYAHQKQYTKAIEVLENIMKIRQADYKYAGQQNVAELVSEINLQKRIEFWGEGIEYLDNRRLNIPVDRTAEGTNHISWAQGVWTQDMPNFLYQIPIDEIDANSMIGPEDQN
jgi:tetratricopeptide (TPR) repeat protein